MKAGLPTTSIGSGSERRSKELGNKGMAARLPTLLGPNSHQRRSDGASVLSAASTAGVSGSITGEIPSIPFEKAFGAKSGASSLFPPRFPGFPTRGSGDRKSTRLNSSHTVISYAVFCLKKKKHILQQHIPYRSISSHSPR